MYLDGSLLASFCMTWADLITNILIPTESSLGGNARHCCWVELRQNKNHDDGVDNVYHSSDADALR